MKYRCIDEGAEACLFLVLLFVWACWTLFLITINIPRFDTGLPLIFLGNWFLNILFSYLAWCLGSYLIVVLYVCLLWLSSREIEVNGDLEKNHA